MIIFWILLNLAVIFDAIGDALIKRKIWIWSKTFQLLMIFSFAGMIVLAQYMPFKIITFHVWARFILMYGLIRVGLFNATWGIVAFKIKNWNWYYIGRTSLWDRMLEWICAKMGFPEKHFLFLLYSISWIISIGILINGFYLIHD